MKNMVKKWIFDLFTCLYQRVCGDQPLPCTCWVSPHERRDRRRPNSTSGEPIAGSSYRFDSKLCRLVYVLLRTCGISCGYHHSSGQCRSELPCQKLETISDSGCHGKKRRSFTGCMFYASKMKPKMIFCCFECCG